MYRDEVTEDNCLANLRENVNNSNARQQGLGRISYEFVNLDSLIDYGDDLLDFVDNPTHPSINSIAK